MGVIEDKYFHRPAGEITLLPPIDIEPALIVIDMQYHDAHPEQGVVAAVDDAVAMLDEISGRAAPRAAAE